MSVECWIECRICCVDNGCGIFVGRIFRILKVLKILRILTVSVSAKVIVTVFVIVIVIGTAMDTVQRPSAGVFHSSPQVLHNVFHIAGAER